MAYSFSRASSLVIIARSATWDKRQDIHRIVSNAPLKVRQGSKSPAAGVSMHTCMCACVRACVHCTHARPTCFCSSWPLMSSRRQMRTPCGPNLLLQHTVGGTGTRRGAPMGRDAVAATLSDTNVPCAAGTGLTGQLPPCQAGAAGRGPQPGARPFLPSAPQTLPTAFIALPGDAPTRKELAAGRQAGGQKAEGLTV